MNEEERAWMMRRIKEPLPTPIEASGGISRRGVLLGAAGLGAAALVGAGAMSRRSEAAPVSSPEVIREARLAREQALERSGAFKEEVGAHRLEMETKHEISSRSERSEIDILMGRSDRDSIDGKTCALFFRDTVEAGLLAEGLPPSIAAEIAHFVPGLIAKESHYNNAAEGPEVVTRYADGRVIREKAQSRIQALPSTFADKGFDVANIRDPHEQARFLVRYFKDAYATFRDARGFKDVQQRYFPGDAAGFGMRFMALALINAYHAGPDTIHDVVTWFSGKRFRPELAGSAYGVYREMTRIALRTHQDPERNQELPDNAKRFGPHAEGYIPELFAFAGAIGDTLERRAGV